MAADQTTQISVPIPGLFYTKAFYFCFFGEGRAKGKR